MNRFLFWPGKIVLCILYIFNHQTLYFQQINYLIDEAYNVGKGANTIISMLHHFLNAMAMERARSTCMLITVQPRNCFAAETEDCALPRC